MYVCSIIAVCKLIPLSKENICIFDVITFTGSQVQYFNLDLPQEAILSCSLLVYCDI